MHAEYSRIPGVRSHFRSALFCMLRRSPLLGIVSGAVASSLFTYAIFRITMFPTQVANMIDGSVGEVLTAPLISSGFTCVYGVRGLRLLVMYNRHLRGRWVRVLDERGVIKGLVATYLSIQSGLWSAIMLYGLNRWALSIFRCCVPVCVDLEVILAINHKYGLSLKQQLSTLFCAIYLNDTIYKCYIPRDLCFPRWNTKFSLDVAFHGCALKRTKPPVSP